MRTVHLSNAGTCRHLVMWDVAGPLQQLCRNCMKQVPHLCQAQTGHGERKAGVLLQVPQCHDRGDGVVTASQVKPESLRRGVPAPGASCALGKRSTSGKLIRLMQSPSRRPWRQSLWISIDTAH
eukprot:UN4517